jgi:hypothetical protein
MDVMGLTPKRPCAKHIPSPRGRLPEWRPAQVLTLGGGRAKGEFLREFRVGECSMLPEGRFFRGKCPFQHSPRAANLLFC